MAHQVNIEKIAPPQNELVTAGVIIQEKDNGIERITAAGIGIVSMNEAALEQFNRHMVVGDTGRVEALVFVRGGPDINETANVALTRLTYNQPFAPERMQNTLQDIEIAGKDSGHFSKDDSEGQIIIVQSSPHGGLRTHVITKGKHTLGRAMIEKNGHNVTYETGLESLINQPNVGWHEISTQQGTRLAEVIVAADTTAVTQAEELEVGLGTHAAGAGRVQHPVVAQGFVSPVYDLERSISVTPAVSALAARIETGGMFNPDVYTGQIALACKGEKLVEPATIVITDASLAGQLS